MHFEENVSRSSMTQPRGERPPLAHLENESLSNYASSSSEVKFNQKDSSLENFENPSMEFNDYTSDDVDKDTGTLLSSKNLKKNFSVFFGGVTDEASPSISNAINEVTGFSRMDRVKKKMSMMFTFTSANTHSTSSDTDTLNESDVPSFYENRVAKIDQLGKRKLLKTRKLGAAMQSQHHVHLLTNMQLIGITFFVVSGGPYEIEPTVGAGGPGLMLLGLLLFPALWAAPLAYMTAELSCMIPESGGHVLWVYRAFGPFWSFVNSCFAFTCSVLDNALYPVLFVEYVSTILYEDKKMISYSWSVFLKVFTIFLVTTINILGIDIVGFTSLALAFMVVAPLATMCVIGLFYLNFEWLDSSNNQSGGPDVIDWKKFFTLLLWNTSGFDAVGTCAAEVRNPGHSYPHALAVSLALIVSVYALPTVIGVSVLPNYLQWKEGTYMIVAKLIGGDLLKGWMGISAASSALGLLLTRLCTNSRIVYGMALVEQAHPVFAKLHPIYGTPWIAILATSLCTLLMSGFNFYSLAEADMLFYALSTILKFAALVQLRFTEPDAFRPYRIPVENSTLVACALIPIGLCISVIWLSSERAHGIVLAGAAGSILLFIIKEVCVQYGSQAEEAMGDRMSRIQVNMNNMQKRIDKVIAEEFAAPLSNLGQAIRLTPQQLRSGFTRRGIQGESSGDIEDGDSDSRAE